MFTKRQKERAEAEARARGEPVDYPVHEADESFRWQVWYALEGAVTQVRFAGVTETAHRHLTEEYGVGALCSQGGPTHPNLDLKQFILERGSTPQLMDVIETIGWAVVETANRRGQPEEGPGQSRLFLRAVRDRMREHKLAYDIVEEGQVVERDAEELHVEAVAPALTLLHGRPRFADAERQYREALDELAQGNWADAITDANAAAEVVARTLLGYEKGQLPGLLAELRVQGLFGSEQEGRLKKFVDGLSVLAGIRNTEGDAHGGSSDRPTAWLAVHWAGALIVYLVEAAEARES